MSKKKVDFSSVEQQLEDVESQYEHINKKYKDTNEYKIYILQEELDALKKEFYKEIGIIKQNNRIKFNYLVEKSLKKEDKSS